MDSIRQACEGVTRRIDRKYLAECGRKNEFPGKLWEAMIKAGLLQLGISEEYGGMGGGLTELAYAMDTLSQAGLMPVIMVPNGLARIPILKHGTESQKKKYLPPTTTGEKIFCFCITEPNAGTNTFKIETKAIRQPNGDYLLNGQKLFITSFDVADQALVVARTTLFKEVKNRREGLSLFIVDTKAEGVESHRQDIGLYLAEKQFSVFFEDVVVPKENLIGEEGQGIRYLFDGLNPERLLAVAGQVGSADFVIKKAVEYANVRAPFDKPIGSYQAIQHPLAHAKASVEATRLMLYEACRKFDSGGDAGVPASYAKLLASEALSEASDIAMQAHGGYAFDVEYDVLPFYLLARASRVGPVNNEMMLNFIGEHVLGLPKSY